jgi:hypothetical protein
MTLKGFELNAAELTELYHGIQEGTDGLTLHYPTFAWPIASCDSTKNTTFTVLCCIDQNRL